MKAMSVKEAYLKVLIIIIVLFAVLRFVNLEADFPAGITQSGLLYTDEGWWANAASNHFITGKWYVEGDYNPIVNLPIGQLIQAATFSIFGLKLVSARLTVSIFSIFLVLLTYLLARRYVNNFISWLVAFLLIVNFFFFAYSRLAILEVLMLSFIVLSILVASAYRTKHHILIIVLSSSILAIAALTKTTAIFALPVLMYVSSLRQENIKKRLLLSGISALIFFAVFITYNYLASSSYPDDFSYFKEFNINSKFSWYPIDIAKNAIKAVWRARCISPIIYPFSIFLSSILLVRSRKFRNNILVRLSFLWLFLYFGFLSTTSYQPQRYYLPLLIPTVVLFSISIVSVHKYLKKPYMVFLQCLVVLYATVFNGYKVVEYIRKPSFTFVDMARDVKQIINRDYQDYRDVILLGHFANSISLETGIQSINTTYGTGKIQWKMAKYKPQYYISKGLEHGVVNILNESYRLEHISKWDVFNNYCSNKKVRLFKLHEKTDIK